MQENSTSQFDLSDPLIAVIDTPVVGRRAIGRFSTEAEARSAEVEFCKRIAEREQQERQQREQENARRRAEFAERIGAKYSTLRRHFRDFNYATARVDGFLYRRSEFATQRPREARRPLRRRSSAQRIRRQGSSRRGPPPLEGDDDPPGSPEPRLAQPSSADGCARP